MVIAGSWHNFDDGVTRPVLMSQVISGDGRLVEERFLVDSGADRTAFSADLLNKLRLSHRAPASDLRLSGISGETPFVVVETCLVLTPVIGDVAHVRGQFAAFTVPAATDLSILGRDVLDHFDVIQSRQRNEVWLLAGNHRYQILE